MTWAEIMSGIWQVVLAILVATIPLFVPPLLKRLLDKLGADADAKRRDALTTAIVNGLVLGLDALGHKQGDDLTPQAKIAAAAKAADYALKTVPDTIKKLNVPPENLIDLAAARLPIVLGTFGPAGVVAGTLGAAVIGGLNDLAKAQK